MKNLVFSLILIFSTNAYPAPAVEGLFRGGSNPLNIYDWSVFRLRVTKTVKAQDNQNPEPEIPLSTQDETRYVKVLFTTSNQNKIKFIQVDYASPQMRKNEILKVTTFGDLLRKSEEILEPEKILFFGLIHSLANADSRLISKLLKVYSTDFQKNKELLDKEKLALYESYKQYLIETPKKERAEKPSPMKPEDIEEYNVVKETLKKPLYIPTNQVKLVSKNNQYFWRAGIDNFEAYFTVKDHFFRELRLNTPQGEVAVRGKNYRKMFNNFALPSHFTIKDAFGGEYSVEVKNFQQFGKTSGQYSRLLKQYQVNGDLAFEFSPNSILF
ncbi:MAG: hypothetical protein ACPGJV_07940 [Bacteriovoracaceae bacterium]